MDKGGLETRKISYFSVLTVDLVIAALNVTLLKRNPESAIHPKAVHTLRV